MKKQHEKQINSKKYGVLFAQLELLICNSQNKIHQSQSYDNTHTMNHINFQKLQQKEDFFDFINEYQLLKFPQERILSLIKRNFKLQNTQNFQIIEFNWFIQQFFNNMKDVINKKNKQTFDLKYLKQKIQKVIYRLIYFSLKYQVEKHKEKNLQVIFSKLEQIQWIDKKPFIFIKLYIKFIKVIQSKINQQAKQITVKQIWRKLHKIKFFISVDLKFQNLFFHIATQSFSIFIKKQVQQQQKYFSMITYVYLKARQSGCFRKYLEIIKKYQDSQNTDINVTFVHEYIEVAIKMWKNNINTTQLQSFFKDWLFDGSNNRIKDILIKYILHSKLQQLEEQIWNLKINKFHVSLKRIYINLFIKKLKKNNIEDNLIRFNELINLRLDNENLCDLDQNIQNIFKIYFKLNLHLINVATLKKFYLIDNQKVVQELLKTIIQDTIIQKYQKLLIQKYFIRPLESFMLPPSKILINKICFILKEFYTQIIQRKQIINQEFKPLVKMYHRKYLMPYLKNKIDSITDNELMLTILRTESILQEQSCTDLASQLNLQIYNYCSTKQTDGHDLLRLFEQIPKKSSLLMLLRYIFYATVNKKLNQQKLEKQFICSIRSRLSSRYYAMKLYSGESFQQIICIYSLRHYNEAIYIKEFLRDIILGWLSYISEKEYCCLIQSGKHEEVSDLLKRRLQLLRSVGFNGEQYVFADYATRINNFYDLFSLIIQSGRDLKTSRVFYSSSKNILQINCTTQKKLHENSPLKYEIQMLINPSDQYSHTHLKIATQTTYHQIDISKPDQIIRVENGQKLLIYQTDIEPILEQLRICIKLYNNRLIVNVNEKNKYRLNVNNTESCMIIIETLDSFIFNGVKIKQGQTTMTLDPTDMSTHKNHQTGTTTILYLNQTNNFTTGIIKSFLNLKYFFLFYNQAFNNLDLQIYERNFIQKIILYHQDNLIYAQQLYLLQILSKIINSLLNQVPIFSVLVNFFFSKDLIAEQINFLYKFIKDIFLDFQIWQDIEFKIQLDIIKIIQNLSNHQNFIKKFEEDDSMFYQICEINKKYFNIENVSEKLTYEDIISIQKISCDISKRLIKFSETDNVICRLKYLNMIIDRDHISPENFIFTFLYQFIIKQTLINVQQDELIAFRPKQIKFFKKFCYIQNFLRNIKNIDLRMKVLKSMIRLLAEHFDNQEYLMSIFDEINGIEKNILYKYINKLIGKLEKENDSIMNLLELVARKFYEYYPRNDQQQRINNQIILKFITLIEQHSNINISQKNMKKLKKMLLKCSEFFINILIENQNQNNYYFKMFIHSYISFILSKFTNIQLFHFLQSYRLLANYNTYILTQFVNFIFIHQIQSISILQTVLQYCFEVIVSLINNQNISQHLKKHVLNRILKYLTYVFQKIEQKQQIEQYQIKLKIDNPFLSTQKQKIQMIFFQISGAILYKSLLIIFQIIENYPYKYKIPRRCITILEKLEIILFKIQQIKIKNLSHSIKQNTDIFTIQLHNYYLEYVYLKIKVLIDSQRRFFLKTNKIYTRLKQFLTKVEKYNIILQKNNIILYFKKISSDSQMFYTKYSNYEKQLFTENTKFTINKLLEMEYIYTYLLKNNIKIKEITVKQDQENEKINSKQNNLSESIKMIESINNSEFLKLSLEIMVEGHQKARTQQFHRLSEIGETGKQIKNFLKEYRQKYLMPYLKNKIDSITDNELMLTILRTEPILQEQSCTDLASQLNLQIYNYCSTKQTDGHDLLRLFEQIPKKSSLLMLLRYIFYATVNKKLNQQKLEKQFISSIRSRLSSRYYAMKLYSGQSFQQIICIYSLRHYNEVTYIKEFLRDIILGWLPYISEKEYCYLIQSGKHEEVSDLLKRRLQLLRSVGFNGEEYVFADYATRINNFYDLFSLIIQSGRDLKTSRVLYSSSKNILQINCTTQKKLHENSPLKYEIQMLINPSDQYSHTHLKIATKTTYHQIDISKPDQIIRVENGQKLLIYQTDIEPILEQLRICIKLYNNRLIVNVNENKYRLNVNNTESCMIIIETLDSFIFNGVKIKQGQTTMTLDPTDMSTHKNHQTGTTTTLYLNQTNNFTTGIIKSQLSYHNFLQNLIQSVSSIRLSGFQKYFLNYLKYQKSISNQLELFQLAKKFKEYILQSLFNKQKFTVQKQIDKNLIRQKVQKQIEWYKMLKSQQSLFYQQKFHKKPIKKLRFIQLPDLTRPILKLTDKYSYNLNKVIETNYFNVNVMHLNKKQNMISELKRQITFSEKCQYIKVQRGYFSDLIINELDLSLQIITDKSERPRKKPYIFGMPQNYLKYKQISKKIYFCEIQEIISKKFNQILNISIQIYLKNGKSVFLVLYTQQKVSAFFDTLQKHFQDHQNILIRDSYQTFHKRKYTQKWQNYQISNFQYLMIINKFSSRSYKDISQSYIFPWVLKQYNSDQINLDDPQVYRDFSKPIALINQKNYQIMVNKYLSQDYSIKYFFMNSLYFSRFLVRLQPYTTQSYKTFSNKFDLYQRLFNSISKQFKVVQQDTNQQTTELIPQFFYFGSFLKNINNIKFSSQKINDDVVLPKWANQDSNRFISIMKAALQSDYVSKNLPKWIQLIFGNKRYESIRIKDIQSKGKLSPSHSFKQNYYHQNINFQQLQISIRNNVMRQNQLDKINNRLTKNNKELQQQIQKLLICKITEVYQYGQFPIQLFRKPHPIKKLLSIQNLHIKSQIINLKPEDSIISIKLINKRIFIQCKTQQKTIWRQLDVHNSRLVSIDQFVEIQKQLKIVSKKDAFLYLLYKRIIITPNEIKQVEESKIFLQKFQIYFSYKKAVAGCRFVAFCGKALRILDYQGNEEYYWDEEQTLDCAFGSNKFTFITSSGVIYTYDYIKKELKQKLIIQIQNQKKKGNKKFNLKYIAYEYRTQFIQVVIIDKCTLKILIEKQKKSC